MRGDLIWNNLFSTKRNTMEFGSGSRRQRAGRRPPNYLSRGMQIRLAGLVFGLAAVVALIGTAADPETWRWFSGASDRNEAARKAAAEDEIDPTVMPRERTRRLRPGEYQVSLADAAGPKDEKPDVAEPSSDELPEDPHDLVRARVLEDVRDDKGWRDEESTAYYHLMNVLKKYDPAQLERHSRGESSFPQLYRQVEALRGKLVTVDAHVSAVAWRERPRHGIPGYYLMYVNLATSDKLVVIHALNLPEGFPTGDDVREDIRATGFLFKRTVVRQEDASHRAPMLLVKTFDWTSRPQPAEEPMSALTIGLIVAGCAVFALAVAALAYYRSKQVSLPGASERQERLSEDQLKSLDQLEYHSEIHFDDSSVPDSGERSSAP